MIRAPPKRAKRTFKKARGNNAPSTSLVALNRSIAARTPSFKRNFFKSHMGGFPPRYTETLRYNTWSSGNVVVGTNTYTEPMVLVVNGPYDPEYSLGGGQPAAFAKLMAIYTKCYVKSAKITATVVNTLGVDAGLQVGLTLTTFGSSIGDPNKASTCGFVDRQFLYHHPDTCVLTQTVDIGKFLSRNVMDGSDTFATVGANPIQLVCAHLWAYCASTTVSGSLQWNIILDMDCVFADPQPFT